MIEFNSAGDYVHLLTQDILVRGIHISILSVMFYCWVLYSHQYIERDVLEHDILVWGIHSIVERDILLWGIHISI